MRKKIIPLTIACFFLGLVLITQIRLEDSIHANTVNSNDVLVNLVNSLESEINMRETYLSGLRTEIDTLSENLSNDETGYSALEGIGLILTIDDKPTVNTQVAVTDASQDIIHYQDLLYIINDLKRGGAEAISINEQRIISASEIRCVGNTILVNMTRLAPPYHIKVIGNPAALQNAIQSSTTYEKLRVGGFPLNYTLTSTYSNNLIQIPAYVGNYSTNYITLEE